MLNNLLLSKHKELIKDYILNYNELEFGTVHIYEFLKTILKFNCESKPELIGKHYRLLNEFLIRNSNYLEISKKSSCKSGNLLGGEKLESVIWEKV